MSSANPFYKFPEEIRPYFIQFDMRFAGFWATQQIEDAWMDVDGLVDPINMVYGASKAVSTMPSGLVEFMAEKGDPIFAELSAMSREYTWNSKFEFNVKEEREKLASDQFTGWGWLPQAMVRARRKLWRENYIAVWDGSDAAALGWDGKKLFATDHRINLVDTADGTQSNLHGSLGFSATNLQTALGHWKNRRNLDGEVMGGSPWGIWAGIDVVESIRDLVMPERASKSGDTTTDKFRSRFPGGVAEIPQLAVATDWGFWDFRDPLMRPIVRILGNGGELERIVHGPDSAQWLAGFAAMQYKERLRCTAGLYHGVMKFTVAA